MRDYSRESSRVTSIRLFILGALDIEGEMHGHQLRQLAEKEHIDMWTDITVGGLYGAIKRLAAEGLIEEARVEREGAYPERQVWRITEAGHEALHALRHEGLRDDRRASPTRSTSPSPAWISTRPTRCPAVARGSARPAASDARRDRGAHPTIAQYLSLGEIHVMKHKSRPAARRDRLARRTARRSCRRSSPTNVPERTPDMTTTAPPPQALDPPGRPPRRSRAAPGSPSPC